ncbi:MAG: M50 family metallopeptidase [Sediminibacterium sp.]|nr:M50 family metallopeptidase [Sediminibacterium sp.]
MKKKNNNIQILRFLGIMCLSILLGYFAGKFGFKLAFTLPKLGIIGLFLLIVPIVFFVIAFHEAGHAVAGIKVGFDFRMYVVGPFLWEREQGKWIFKWNKNVNIAGGMVLCLPVGVANLNKRFLVYAAGGPIASLILSFFSSILFYWLLPTDTAGHNILRLVSYSCLILSFFSFLIFVVTAIPFHSGGFSSDGARVLRLIKGGEAARLEILFLKIVTEVTSGIRPSKLNKNDLEAALAIALELNAPFLVYIYGFLHQVTFDEGNIVDAEKYLQAYIEHANDIPEGIRNSVWLDAAFFYAFAKQDMENATAYFNQFKPAAMIPKAQILATEAVLYFHKNEFELFIEKRIAAEKELPNMIDKGGAIALREKLYSINL